jgi:hypothetical protein
MRINDAQKKVGFDVIDCVMPLDYGQLFPYHNGAFLLIFLIQKLAPNRNFCRYR